MEPKAIAAHLSESIELWIGEAYELLVSTTSKGNLQEQLWLSWRWVRAMVLIPLVRISVALCMIMSVMMIVEKLFQGSVAFYVKLFNRKPEKIYKWEPLGEDTELGNLAYPMVLVQIPMYNEREVYQLSIGAACSMVYPAERVIIQVLDDSTDPTIKELVKTECEKWKNKGMDVRYETRGNRHGYKAGALKEGLKYGYVEQCEHVAIFDADFQPGSDFLMRTIPFLIHNPQIGLVQARWKFVNADECLLTRIQEMSMDFHFKAEQQSGSTAVQFFGFNGTAGVWRIQAINEAGGWKERTTVEDMDLAVRAVLQGWKFLYVGDIKVKSELPSTYKAYRYQLHRWTCGPANLVRKMALEIATSMISVWMKIYLIYSFFIARRVLAHIVTFSFYCLVIPTSVFFPEIDVPAAGVIYIPTAITLLHMLATPSSFHLVIFWVLFENVAAMLRTKAVIVGLLEVGKVNEWVVTKKLGDSSKPKQTANAVKKPRKTRFWDSFYYVELTLSAYLFLCASYNYNHGKNHYFIYIFPQSLAFFIMGVGYVGTFVPRNT